MKLVKTIQPLFKMSYPAMSVYEFDYLKDEGEVLDYWKSSSIYIICQRPVLYFDDIYIADGVISMNIKQRSDDKALSVKIIINEDDEMLSGDSFWVSLHFYETETQTQQPYKNAAGFKLLNDKQEFVVWLTPERLIYEYLNGRFTATIKGNIHEFLTYTVHYIGQSQDQNIWERLTGHEKLSKVLAREFPFIKGEFSPFELSIIFLQFEGFSEATALLPIGSDDVVDSKGNVLSDVDIGKEFISKGFDEVNRYAVNDFEAYLINFFLPKYNKRLYKSYPKMKNGLKSIGYNKIQHNMLLFANLFTEEATYSIKISPIYAKSK